MMLVSAAAAAAGAAAGVGARCSISSSRARRVISRVRSSQRVVVRRRSVDDEPHQAKPRHATLRCAGAGD